MRSSDYSSESKDESGSKSDKKTINQKQIEDKNDKTSAFIEYIIYKYSNNNAGPLFEAILINNKGYFLEIIDGTIKLHEKIEQSEKVVLIPPPDKSSYLSKEYSFLSIEELESYIIRAQKENLSSLFKRVKKIWKKYFDIDGSALSLCAGDTIFTYFQDKLGMTHYLLFVGDNNTGKTNALRIFNLLSYRPILDTEITPANIYNFLDRFEEGQGIILEDEIDSIEDQKDKMKIYKGGYVTGTKVTRLYESASGNKSTRKQQRYYTYCFKAFSSERYPTFFKAKGFNERLLTIPCSSGNPAYDISEVENSAGEQIYKKLGREIEDTRKLLFVYRLLNHGDSIPDIQLSLKNRDKQLCKPLIRLFQNSKALNEIKNSLSKFITEKKNKKLNSLDFFLYSILSDYATKSNNINERTFMISNDILWNIVQTLPGDSVVNKPHSYQTDEFGTVSKIQVTKICEDKFGAERSHDGKQRCLKFKKEVLERLYDNYTNIDKIKITQQNTLKNNLDTNTFNTFNKFWNSIEEKKTRESKLALPEFNENRHNISNNSDILHKASERVDVHNRNTPMEESNNSEKVLEPLKVLGEARGNSESKGAFRKTDFLIYLDSGKDDID